MKKTNTLKLSIGLFIFIFLFPFFGSAYAPVKAGSANLAGCPMFPEDNFWNVPINDLPVHTLSNAWVNTIGASRAFHMDFGEGTWDGGPIGIPYNIVSGASVNFYTFNFYYPDESDAGPYPLPASPAIEWGSDHHILTVDTDDCKLYEVYDASKSGSSWSGGSGAIWNLNSNISRTDEWTSADAAGLPILPGLVRYDEVAAGVIKHALRFTTNCTAGYHIWPARHTAQHGSCATPVPFGARFRLKADYEISGYSPAAKIILQAFKTYGIVLADNGSPWYVSGAPSASWNNDVLHEMDNLNGGDFEAVDTSGLMVNADSAGTNYAFPPGAFSKNSPLNNSDNQPLNMTLKWSASDKAAHYEVCYDSTINNTCDTAWANKGLIKNMEIGSLSALTQYEWNVRAVNGFGVIASNSDTWYSFTTAPLNTITFTSNKANDGWTLESSEFSNVASTKSNTGTLRVGDDAKNKQYRSLLYFDTSSLPNNASIFKVDVKIKMAGNVIGDIALLGDLVADMKKGFFGLAPLELTDFNASGAPINTAGKLSEIVDVANPDWFQLTLSPVNFKYVNLTGVTQFRLRFTKDDNNNKTADLISFYAGEDGTNPPQLSVEYTVP